MEPSGEVSFELDLILGENLAERRDIIKIVIPSISRATMEKIRHLLIEVFLDFFWVSEPLW